MDDKNMVEENLSQEITLKNIMKQKNCLIEELIINDLMNKKHKKVCTNLNHIEHLLVLASAVTECVSTSPIASLVGIPKCIANYAVGLIIYAITAGVKMYKSIIKRKRKKRKKPDKILLLPKMVVSN